MDVVSVGVIGMFAAALAGGLLGLLVGRLTRFELGLATGLLIFGGTTLWFAARCYLDYQTFAYAGANGLWGEVIEIREIPVGESGTQTAPLVRFTAPDETVHTVLGPRASSARVGQHVNVIYDPADPQRSRVGQITELRGGAIAFMLFGTFPVSFALFMLYSALAERMGSLAPKPAPDATGGSRAYTLVSMTLYCTMFGAIVWIGMGPDDELGPRFSQGFGVVAAALVGYAILGLAGRRASSVWAFGVMILALNFGVWSWALHLLL